MKIYINNIEVSSEVLPTDVPTLDESLETLSFVLISNTNQFPIAPMQPVKIVFDNNEEVYFITTTDSVEICSMNPLRYKHTINCTQNTRELSKHDVRNTVITQEPRVDKYSMFAFTLVPGGGDMRYYNFGTGTIPTEPIELLLNHKEKINKAYLTINVQAWLSSGQSSAGNYSDKAILRTDFTTEQELNTILNNGNFGFDQTSIGLYYKDSNDVEHLMITFDELSTWGIQIVFNKEFDIAPVLEDFRDELETAKSIYVKNATNNAPFVQNYDSNSGATFIDCISSQFNLRCETYYYNCYEVLELLLNRYKQEYNTNINVGGTTISKADLFVLPVSGETYNVLRNSVAPNLTFTQNTMYECIADVFRLFDAIFTMDDNKVLSIEYFNSKTDDITDSLKKTGFNSYLGEEKYANSFITYYQDARVKEKFPTKDNFAGLRSQGLGVPDETDHCFIVPHPISKIIKVEAILDSNSFNVNGSNRTVVFENSFGNTITYWLSGDLIVDLTPYVISQELWASLPKQRAFPRDNIRSLLQNNTVYYQENTNAIQLGFSYTGAWNITIPNYNAMIISAYYRMMGGKQVNISDPPSVNLVANDNVANKWRNIKLRVEYLSTVDGKTKVHSVNNKYDGDIIVDQVNGAVDLNKLGLNVLGLVLKNGEPTMQVSVNISSWEDRIKPSQYIDLGADGIWIANTCSYTIFNNDMIQEKVSFVKNFNALSLRTRLLREKRITNISRELVQKSEDIITNYIYFTALGSDQTQTPQAFREMYQAISYYNDYLVESVYLSFATDTSIDLTIDYSVITGTMYDTLNETNTYKVVYIPMTRYGAGNTINFELSFAHPINAGNKTTYYSSSTWAGSNKYYTQAVYYTDESGFLDECSVYVLGKTNYTYSENFPEITEIIYPNQQVIGIGSYKVKKQPNEILALNYQLAFLGYDFNNDFVGSQFINDNFFIDGFQKDRVLKLFVSSTETYDVLDLKGKGTSMKVNSVQYIDVLPSQFVIVFNHNTYTEPIKSWAICDENNNILFAFNKDISRNSTNKRIYFTTRVSRI